MLRVLKKITIKDIVGIRKKTKPKLSFFFIYYILV
jgi:hypothetical protein